MKLDKLTEKNLNPLLNRAWTTAPALWDAELVDNRSVIQTAISNRSSLHNEIIRSLETFGFNMNIFDDKAQAVITALANLEWNEDTEL